MPDFRLGFPPVGSNRKKAFRQSEYIRQESASLTEQGRRNQCMTCDVIANVIFNPPATGGFVRYDLDNLLKPTLDALKGFAYIDDNQVRCIHAAFGRRDGIGSVFVRIEPLIRRDGKVYERNRLILKTKQERD